MEIRGKIKKILWRNYNNLNKNNHIILIETDDGQEYKVSGRFPNLFKNEKIIIEVNDIPNGDLYQATGHKFMIEYNLYSLQKILTVIKGIGKKTAEKILDEVSELFQKDGKITEVSSLDEFIPYLDKLKTVPQDAINIIKSKLKEFMIVDELFNIFGRYIEPNEAFNIAARIVENNYYEIVMENYYRLIDIAPDLNIRRLDEFIKKEFNIDHTNPARILAYIKHVLYSFATDYKHTIVEENMFLNRVMKSAKIDIKTIKQTIELYKNEFEFIDNYIIDKKLYEKETEIADKLYEILTTDVDVNYNQEMIMKYINTLSNKYKVSLAPEQTQAVLNAFFTKVSLITGGAGTGKSTVISFIYDIALNLGYNPVVLAPTGKAASRLEEYDAKTIHFAIGWNGVDASVKLNNDFIIIDEASMVDIDIFYHFLDKIDPKARLILVGDPYQLPPVGVGAPFELLIRSKLITNTELKRVYRQEHSHLLDLAYSVNSRNYGKVLEIISNATKDTISTIRITDKEQLNNIIKIMVNKSDSKFMLLLPLKNDNASYINSKYINKLADSILTSKNITNRKVICIENDYTNKVFNGQIGTYLGVEFSNSKILHKMFFNNKMIMYSNLEFERYIDYAYALTIHKSQGSEYDTVIIPILSDHINFWDKKLLYTAVTRAKKKIIFIVDMNFDVNLRNILIKREIVPKSYFVNKLSDMIKGDGPIAELL
jgi:exodeoxyribonuclease V alpha subunit